MNDLTQGSIPRHIINMALPITVGMLVQTLYFLVDLYFVGALGEVALAGVSAAGNVSFLIMALTQILGVGAVALIAQAVGRKQPEEANLIFNQSLLISVIMVLVTLLAGYCLAEFYMKSISANAETVAVGKTYLFWFIPNLALQFVLVVMGSALRGTGVVKPTMVVQVISVFINILLAPILIAGWVTGYPMGVAGAGLASSIAIIIAVFIMWRYFHRLEKIVYFDRQLFHWHFPTWKKILTLGFPAGGEFILMFFYMGIIYWAIKDFGSVAQAGFGLGSRVMQAIFMPALALAFALPAVVGQNFGAQLPERVKKSLNSTLIMISIIMLLLMGLCLLTPQLLLQPFTKENDVIMIGVVFLQLIALNFIPSGIIFTCSGMFQGLGNTWPSLFSMATRLIFFVIPVVWLSQKSYFKIEHVWYLSVFTVSFQAIISLYLLRVEMRKKLSVIYQ